MGQRPLLGRPAGSGTGGRQVGLDRKALRDLFAKNEFNTIIGPLRFDGSENASVPGTVGQWQGSEFEVVWPPERATAPPIAPKPAWR